MAFSILLRNSIGDAKPGKGHRKIGKNKFRVVGGEFEEMDKEEN